MNVHGTLFASPTSVFVSSEENHVLMNAMVKSKLSVKINLDVFNFSNFI